MCTSTIKNLLNDPNIKIFTGIFPVNSFFPSSRVSNLKDETIFTFCKKIEKSTIWHQDLFSENNNGVRTEIRQTTEVKAYGSTKFVPTKM